MPEVIKSASNEKIKRLRLLKESAKERRKSGLFSAEGVKIFKEAPVEAVEEVYVSESFAADDHGLLENVPYHVIDDGLFARVCDTKTPQGMITVFRQPQGDLKDIIGERPLIAVLENVQDPGNVGTVIRTAEGAGATVLIGSGCADVFSPKTVRSTMGSIFRVPFTVSEDLVRDVRILKRSGITVYAAHLAAEKFYDEYDYSEGCALLIGNEGNGLSKELADEADALLMIPMEGKLESLNAAVAASILMYEVHSKRKGSSF